MEEEIMLAIQENDDENVTLLHGDILEAILSFVPLVDLISACRVSKPWLRAVFSSLTNFNPIKPWLFVHTQSNRSFAVKTINAYDPRSSVWVQIDQPLVKYGSTLRSSGSTLMYVISCSKLSFSDDPFLLKWRQVDGPSVWRMDPIVSLCGSRIVVAGSGWYFEDDPLAVEVYDPELSTWRRCQSMPEILKGSAAATWLSVAANHDHMFVTEKASGITYTFDPCAGTWRGPYDLRADPRAFFSAVGFAGEDLIVASLIGDDGTPESLQLYKVNCERMACESIGEAPPTSLGKLMGEKESIQQIEISAANNFVYIYNPSDPEEIVFCEISRAAGVDCVWGSARNTAWNDDVRIGGRMVFTCGRVEIGDLQAAMKSPDRKLHMSY